MCCVKYMDITNIHKGITLININYKKLTYTKHLSPILWYCGFNSSVHSRTISFNIHPHSFKLSSSEQRDHNVQRRAKSIRSLWFFTIYSKTPFYCPSIHRQTRVSPRISAVPFSVWSNNPVKMPNSHTAIRHSNWRSNGQFTVI